MCAVNNIILIKVEINGVSSIDNREQNECQRWSQWGRKNMQVTVVVGMCQLRIDIEIINTYCQFVK